MAAPSLQPDAMGHWWVSHGPEDDEPTCHGCGQSMTLGSRTDPPAPRLEPCPRPYTRPPVKLVEFTVLVRVPGDLADDHFNAACDSVVGLAEQVVAAFTNAVAEAIPGADVTTDLNN